MKKIILSLMLVVTMLTGVVATTGAVYADDEGSGGCGGSTAFFGLRPWYEGLTTNINGKCEIKTPTQDELPTFVWKIVLNILIDLSVLVGYIAVIMVAWGGYLYMFSRGLPDRAERGKKTLIAATVGLLISIFASVIMNTIMTILGAS